jgi:Protein of unknown function (DUF3563)
LQIVNRRKTMFAPFLVLLNAWFEKAERKRREALLASSQDIYELEHRIRTFDKNGWNSR